MSGMSEWFRKFGLLLYKDFLVRKRHWKSTLILQIILPFLLFMMCLLIRDLGSQAPKNIDNDTYYPRYPLNKDFGYPSIDRLFYAPNNTETKELMIKVGDCLYGKNNYTSGKL